MKYVFIQEEYGYRHWVGQVPSAMTIEQLVAWWESLPSVRPLFFNPNGGFPMPLHEVEDVAHDDADVATWSWTDDQGEKHILNRDTVIAFFHTHEDDDSYMKVVGGDHHHHKGYGSFEPEEDDDDDDDELPPITEEDKEKLKAEHPHVYTLIYETEKIKVDHPHAYKILFEEIGD